MPTAQVVRESCTGGAGSRCSHLGSHHARSPSGDVDVDTDPSSDRLVDVETGSDDASVLHAGGPR